MMADRGISVTHTTILRWVQRYLPEFEKRWWRYARPVGGSWRMDETYIKVHGQWVYLYRAVDKAGQTVDFFLSPNRRFAITGGIMSKTLVLAPHVYPAGAGRIDGHACGRRNGFFRWPHRSTGQNRRWRVHSAVSRERSACDGNPHRQHWSVQGRKHSCGQLSGRRGPPGFTTITKDLLLMAIKPLQRISNLARSGRIAKHHHHRESSRTGH